MLTLPQSPELKLAAPPKPLAPPLTPSPQYWLGHVGSPASSITRLDVSKEGPIGALAFTEMMRRPNVP
jgi:hypothetical protein